VSYVCSATMSTEKTKLAIVKKVLALEDEAILQNVHAYLASEPSVPWGEKSKQTQSMIERSLNELDLGEGRSHQQVMARYSKWLKPSAGRPRQKRASTK